MKNWKKEQNFAPIYFNLLTRLYANHKAVIENLDKTGIFSQSTREFLPI